MKQWVGENSFIEANNIKIGKNVRFGKDISIKVRGDFEIGDYSYIGDRFNVNAEEVKIGKHFFNMPTDSRGMVIGGGSSNFPYAKLNIGDRVVCHTGHINLARSVNIGDDVGLSHDVDIISHGFWSSVLDGYPSVFDGVTIGNNVIVGWKSIIMMGVDVCDDVVIGSNSTVIKNIKESGIYAGTPAKFIRNITEPSLSEKKNIFDSIINEWNEMINDYYVKDGIKIMSCSYPKVQINNLEIDVNEKTCYGEHDTFTDAFRDFLRRYGIRVFCDRPFTFNIKRK